VTLYGFPRETPSDAPGEIPGEDAALSAALAELRLPRQRPPAEPEPAGFEPYEPALPPVAEPALTEVEEAAAPAETPAEEPEPFKLIERTAEPVAVEERIEEPAVKVEELDLGRAAEPEGAAEFQIEPWDRRPLMIVLAASAALVLLAVLSGVATAQMFDRDNGARWRTGASEPQPTPSATPAPVVPPTDPSTVTLSGVGDVIMGSLPGDVPPRNGAGFFDAVKDALASDLVMGNLETPLTPDTGKVKCTPPPPGQTSGCHQFYLPMSYADHLKAGGFQLLNLANNHTNDMGPVGLRNTKTALESAGIEHTGAPNQITYMTVKGVKVAVLGFGVYAWGQNLNNIPAARDLVRKAAAKADIVVVQMQGGAEGADKAHVRPGHERYLGEDRGDLIAFSHAVIDAGADVVFGHGPHIMRGMEFYKGRLIAYSLGNFCGYGVLNSAGYLGVGGVLSVSLHRDGTWADGHLVPTEMVHNGLPAVDSDKRALSFVNGLSRADFGPNGARVGSDGKITPPDAA
jgi:hypothetical protein